LEFFAYETIAGQFPEKEAADLKALVDKCLADDDCQQYLTAHNGTVFKPNGGGYLPMEVLPELTGIPFNNLALGFIQGLRPSDLRVAFNGRVCLDAFKDRVTVYLDDNKKISKIVKEMDIGYGCGDDMARILGELKGGGDPRELKPHGGCFGHAAGLERINFE